MANRSELERLAYELRCEVLHACARAGTGHVGSIFSVMEILVVLRRCALRGQPSDPSRDRLILSKGHACLGLYALLHREGILDTETFATFGRDGGALGCHPPYDPARGLEASTGSLGHGLSIGAGLSFAARRLGGDARHYVVMSDGDTNEGSTWEAAAFAAHHRLDNLCAIVDLNGLQAMGLTSEILGAGDAASRWRGFGWEVWRVDGHDVDALEQACLAPRAGRPRVVLARTVKGKGVSFMENEVEWHYRCPRGDAYRVALLELEQRMRCGAP